jgi:hypothetical protein
MKLTFARALLMVAAAAFFTPAQAADTQFPPGSHVGLTPPPGFSSSEAFRGFDDRANSSAILMLEMPQAAFAEVTKTMTADSLKKQGIVMEKREDLSLKNGKGVLVTGYQEANGEKLRKWILIAELPKLTALVTALVPDKSKAAHPDATMREALASVSTRDKVPVEEMLGLLPFKIDNLADLRPFRVEPNTLFLTEGPKDTLNGTEQPLLVVSAASGGPAENSARDAFARNMFEGLPGYSNVQIVGADMLRLSGMQTHQLFAEAKDEKTGDPVKLVQWIRFGNGAFVRFLGIAKSDAWQDAFNRFRTVRDGLAAR